MLCVLVFMPASEDKSACHIDLQTEYTSYGAQHTTNDQWMAVFNYSYHYQAGQKHCWEEDGDSDFAVDNSKNKRQCIIPSCGFR